MPIINTEVKDDRQTDYYKTSPVMSTYLVVFVICDFDSRFIQANTTTPTNVSTVVFICLRVYHLI